MGIQTSVNKIGSASDVTNVNPMTGGFYNQLLGLVGQNQAGMAGTTADANLTALGSTLPAMQQMTGLMTGEYVQSGQQAANIASQNAIQQLASQFSGMNALNSGAALSAMTRGAMEPQAQLVQNIAGLQSGIMGNLANTFIGQRGAEYNTQAGLLGQVLGQAGQFSAPEWWQPTYETTQTPGMFSTMLQGGIGGAGAGAAFGPAGAGIGAGIGGALGLLSGLFG